MLYCGIFDSEDIFWDVPLVSAELGLSYDIHLSIAAQIKGFLADQITSECFSEEQFSFITGDENYIQKTDNNHLWRNV